jgi:hypothetical protein
MRHMILLYQPAPGLPASAHCQQQDQEEHDGCI